MKLFLIWSSGSGEDVVKRYFLSRSLATPLLGGAEPTAYCPPSFRRKARGHRIRYSVIPLTSPSAAPPTPPPPSSSRYFVLATPPTVLCRFF